MLDTKEKMLSNFLDKITQEIDLPEFKYQQAIERYEAVGNFLSENNSNSSDYNPIIYSHGSFRLGTVVKPFKAEEFDIDLVCQLSSSPSIGQKKLYELVGNRLNEDGKYRKILQPKTRCWRLKYANEFHMDILPAIPDSVNTDHSILIPDKELHSWQFSNPIDYVDWFYDKMEQRRKELILEAKVDIEDVPFYRFKTPLQKSIQILKRHRDILFENDQDDKPISIIITTLAAKAYNNDHRLFESLMHIVENMPKQFDNLNGDIVVLNPVNKKENFADKWETHKERKEKFLKWLDSLKYSIDEILGIKGFQRLDEKLGTMFGKSVVERVFKRHPEVLEEYQKAGLLKVSSTGLLGSVGTEMKKNTFYGKEKKIS